MDFFSAYLNLLTQMDNDSFMISLDRNVISRRASALSELIHEYYPESAFYITEWTSVPIVYQNTPVQSSCYQAAFICHAALGIQNYCDKMGYWAFKDTISPESIRFAGNSPVYFWGRGLLSEASLPVPSFYAFMLLNKLGDKLIRRAENFCVTKKSSGSFQVLAFSYEHFAHTALLEADSASSFSEIYKFFEKTGPFQFSGTEQDNSKQGQDYLTQGCIPEERMIYVEAQEDITLDIMMASHMVCLWDVMPLV